MQQLRKIIAAIGVAMFAMFIATPAQAGGGGGVENNPNEIYYWQNQYPGTVCYKDDSSLGHEGSDYVKLYADGWKVLIVNGGSEDNVVVNPDGGTKYYTPDNASGGPAGLSHWIVCGEVYQPYNETVCWLMPADLDPSSTPPAGAESTFPQQRVSCDDPIPCERWVQKDLYLMETAKEDELYKSLGDTLDWVNGHPEDSKIYVSHQFLPGPTCEPETVDICNADYEKETVPADSDAAAQFPAWDEETCVPPPAMCENIDMTIADAEEAGYIIEDGNCYIPVTPTCLNLDMTIEEAEEAGYIVDEEGNCTMPPPMCENLDKTVEEAAQQGYFYDEETGDCFKKVYVCKYVQGPGNNEIPQPSENNPISVSVNSIGGFTGTLPYWFNDGQYNSVAFAWAVPGTPQDEEPSIENCPTPPPTMCANLEMTLDDAEEAGYYIDEEENCFPPVTVCGPNWAPLDIPYDEYIAGEGAYKLYDEETCQPPRAPTPPTLTGTVGAECIDDYPWITYDVLLTDPDGQVAPVDAEKVTFTFSNPLDATEFVTVEKTLTGGAASGMFPWFGADQDSDGTPDGWPGWVDDGLGGFVPDLSANFGWTRAGLDVEASVNPSFTVTGLAYPSATDPCEPVVVEQTESAPPATPVTAEAQYAG